MYRQESTNSIQFVVYHTHIVLILLHQSENLNLKSIKKSTSYRCSEVLLFISWSDEKWLTIDQIKHVVCINLYSNSGDPNWKQSDSFSCDDFGGDLNFHRFILCQEQWSLPLWIEIKGKFAGWIDPSRSKLRSFFSQKQERNPDGNYFW